jgi:predicted Rossmann fold nucleotide-binding protein DprA/Smf involved in DNA uptake
MEYQILEPGDRQYPAKLTQRMGKEAPVLYYHGPLKLLNRFSVTVIAADMTPAQAMLASNDMLFVIREYALNYVGPWHAVMETEIFRLALDTPTDPTRLRSLTILTARGLARETLDNFLGDRFGYKGPFTGFPQKEEFYRRAKEEELLWLSVTEPNQKPFLRKSILFRNWVSCALADVVFVPFAEKGSKTLITVKKVVKAGIPVFTCQYDDNKENDVNKDLFNLGIAPYKRKTIGAFLESLGAGKGGEPPFPKKEEPSLPIPPLLVRERPQALYGSKKEEQLDLLSANVVGKQRGTVKGRKK